MNTFRADFSLTQTVRHSGHVKLILTLPFSKALNMSIVLAELREKRFSSCTGQEFTPRPTTTASCATCAPSRRKSRLSFRATSKHTIRGAESASDATRSWRGRPLPYISRGITESRLKRVEMSRYVPEQVFPFYRARPTLFYVNIKWIMLGKLYEHFSKIKTNLKPDHPKITLLNGTKLSAQKAGQCLARAGTKKKLYLFFADIASHKVFLGCCRQGAGEPFFALDLSLLKDGQERVGRIQVPAVRIHHRQHQQLKREQVTAF
jgi:hypothetical protein